MSQRIPTIESPDRPRLVLTASVGMLLLSQLATASDWPQWRGPRRDGRSAETGLLQAWPEAGPPLAWSAAGLGQGFSSVAVAGGRVFTMGDLDDGQYVVALKEDGGELLWKTRVGSTHEDDYGGPRATPTTDGDLLYVMTTGGELVCLEAATGKQRWRRNLTAEFDAFLMQANGNTDWRFSESPLVDGERVVVTPGHVRALMVAFDKTSGEEMWRTQGRRLGPIGADGAGYSSVVISEAAGTRQYVQLVGRGLIGVEAASGRLLWSYNRVANDIANIATPIVHEDYVFSSTGYGTGAALVRIRRDGEEIAAEEVYFLEADTLQNHHGGMILHAGTLFTGTGHNKGFPIAVDFMTGEVAWGPERNAGKSSAAISFADGRIYFRYQDGLMILVEATPEGYREHGSFMIPEVTKPSWSHPVIANGRLLLREQERLYSYDIAAPERAAASDAGGR